MTVSKAWLALVAASLVAGCASTPNTVAHSDPNTDFNQYKTFGFFEPLSTDDEKYESLLSNFLKVAMAQELDKRGMTFDGDPDVLVNFYVNTQEKIRSRSVPTAGAYYGYRDPFYDPWVGYGGWETQIDQYTEGTLNIDVVDAATRKLVWEGSISGRVRDEHVRNLEQTIDQAVAEVMANYPIAPGGAPQP